MQLLDADRCKLPLLFLRAYTYSTLQGETVATLSALYSMNSLPAPATVRTSMHLVIPSHDGITVVAVSYVCIIATRRAHIPDCFSHFPPPLRDCVSWFKAAITGLCISSLT